MAARFASILLAAAATAATANLALAQATADLRCVAEPDTECVIELAERSFPNVREDRWYLVVPNLAEAMLYSGRIQKGVELAGKIQSPVLRARVDMTHAYVLFHEGKPNEARDVLEARAARTTDRVRNVVLWAQEAYERGDRKRGDAAFTLAHDILKDHEAKTGETVLDVSLPSAIAASGEIGAAIEMVRQMPPLPDRARAAFLLMRILANEPDTGPARILMEEASAWRASLHPRQISVSLIEEAWAWLMLGDTAQVIATVSERPVPKRRNSAYGFLISEAGTLGHAENALILAEEIEDTTAKAWALSHCAKAAFTSGHHDAGSTCLQSARGLFSEVVDMAERGGLDEEASRNVKMALATATIAESLAGNDAAAADIMNTAARFTSDLDDRIIAAHIDAGDLPLAMLLAFQDADDLKRARALSALARALAIRAFFTD